MGLSYEHQSSGLSESHYVHLDGLKIRFSNHSAKPTYEALNGSADCEIGVHEMAASDDWKRALAFICWRLEATSPARYASLCAAYAADRTAKAERERVQQTPEYKADMERRIADRVGAEKAQREADWLKVAPHYEAIKDFDRRALTGDLAGKNRREKRKAARVALELMIGLTEARFRHAMWCAPREDA
jgi:hypothetical protein